ncbi:NADPH-dependent glutamate synthase [Candidatus Sumerlaeota bacterium]|nr:NADPH-dependent glutamate synthase [Candidatus Sumerlaeota bacterium]
MKERIPRQDMPKQIPKVRAKNFDEVALGYSEETAVIEARRCLQCKNKPCVAGCPVEIDIPAFILKIRERDFKAAAKILKDKNALPAICGRVCPQEDQCEKACILGKKSQPVAIGRLERFVADWEAEHPDQSEKVENASPKSAIQKKNLPGKAAVIGAGPSGLTVAGDLAKLSYEVVIFEAFHKPGGVLVYGIPEFRLPKAIVEREIEYVKSLGVEIKTDYVIGRIFTIDELLQNGFDAVYIATGAGLPSFMNIPGENLNGVYSSNEFLTRSNLMKAYLFPEYKTPIKIGGIVAVVGGGNVAMDSARTALRLGADEVHLIYRRSRTEMPARIEEIENAEEEGVIFHLLTNPVRILGEKKENLPGMWVKTLECLKMELGAPDDSGRRRPVPISGSEFLMPIDTVIMAIGTKANPIIATTTPDLAINKWGYIIADSETGETNKPGVFAGGDIVTGSATVIGAMGAGRKAARAIHEYISQKNQP